MYRFLQCCAQCEIKHRPKKKMCVSGFYPNPGRFDVKCEQNVVKCAERLGAGGYIEKCNLNYFFIKYFDKIK